MSVTARPFAGAIALAAITGVAGSAAHAQSKQEFNWCIGEDNPTPAQKITGCTAVIQAGKLKGKRLVFTFSNRGVAYYERGEYDRAIQNYDQAIKLNPNHAGAYYNRSLAKKQKGDQAGAEADLAAARKINPNIGR